jgi:hypothetical protein
MSNSACCGVKVDPRGGVWALRKVNLIILKGSGIQLDCSASGLHQHTPRWVESPT